MNNKTIKVIVNRKSNISKIDNVYSTTSAAMKLIFESLKIGIAKKLIDTDETLMYEIKSK